MEHEEFEVDGLAEIGEGEMRQVRAGEEEVLVARVGGKLCAVGAYCPHYHAPLVEGLLAGSRLVCPWHHACFDVTTGALEEPPALSGLPRYEVREEAGRAFVRLPAAEARGPRRADGGAPGADSRTFVVVGGGAAGFAAVGTLREEGFRGRVVLITREEVLPYDRPNLSKEYLAGKAEPEWLPLSDPAYFEEAGVEVRLGREVALLEAGTKTLTLDDGETIAYDAALVATGAVARRPAIPGADLPNVFTLRSLADADAVARAASEAARAVVVGAGFIGMEAAASLRERGLDVTVVAPGRAPFERALGPEIGAMLRDAHEERGVRFALGETVASFGGGGSVREVVLGGGARLAVDFVLLGVGVRPATDFLRGVALDGDGAVTVDEYLCAGDGLYAAGDVASFPNPRAEGRSRIEHWRTAEQQGRVAARNMLGRAERYDAVPFFWTRQFDVGVQVVGHAPRWDELLVDGSVADGDFLACYVKGGRVVAAAASNRDRDLAAVAELMRIGAMPPAEAVRAGSVDWQARLASTRSAGESR